MLSIAIVLVFVFGYLCIALEDFTKINKAAVALFMFVACWTLFMFHPSAYLPGVAAGDIAPYVNTLIEKHLGNTATTLFFLMGAMTIVEVVDQYGGFNFVRDLLRARTKRALLWRVAFLTFFLSAILDNMTTTIVMIMVLRKLVAEPRDRVVYVSLIVIAANAGGAFSPIGDVTTIMLWNTGRLSALGVMEHLLLPALTAMIVPALLMQRSLKGELAVVEDAPAAQQDDGFSPLQHRVIFFLGVGGLVCVPLFHELTGLPPFVGILLVLSVVWMAAESFYRHRHPLRREPDPSKRVANLISRIDMSTILFFLGVLMAVACLEEIGVLLLGGQQLEALFHGNYYFITGIIGVLSSIVDNVPLVAGSMGMYPLAETGAFAMDGQFWQLLAYCAGVGGSILIIGSTAGVVAMGLERISFGAYMKHTTLPALLGYLAGMMIY